MEIDRSAMQDRQVIVGFQRDISNRSCRSKIEDVMRTEVNSSVYSVNTCKVSSSPSLHHLTTQALAHRLLRVPNLAPGQSQTISVLAKRQQHLLQPVLQLLNDV